MKQLNNNLSSEQKKILFDSGTEPPFSGELLHNDKTGDYMCANCGQTLFESSTKFDSGSGWPSFYDVKTAKSVKLVEDTTLGMQRVEATCSKCGVHLGHVFNDAYNQPTGTRFCINSLALDFNKVDDKKEINSKK